MVSTKFTMYKIYRTSSKQSIYKKLTKQVIFLVSSSNLICSTDKHSTDFLTNSVFGEDMLIHN